MENGSKKRNILDEPEKQMQKKNPAKQSSLRGTNWMVNQRSLLLNKGENSIQQLIKLRVDGCAYSRAVVCHSFCQYFFITNATY